MHRSPLDSQRAKLKSVYLTMARRRSFRRDIPRLCGPGQVLPVLEPVVPPTPGRIYPDVSLSRVSSAAERLSSSSRASYLKRSKAEAGIVPRFCRAKPRHSSFSLYALACMMNISLAAARARDPHCATRAVYPRERRRNLEKGATHVCVNIA